MPLVVRILLIALGLALGAPLRASAFPLPFNATLTLQLGVFGTFVVNGSGVGDFGPAGGTASVPAGAFSIGQTVAYPAGLTIGGLVRGVALAKVGQWPGGVPFSAASNLPFQFGGLTGTMGLDASVYLLNKLGKAVGEPIPVGVVGVGGTSTFGNLLGLVSGTVLGNPYQLGMVTVNGVAFGNVTNLVGTGFDARDANGIGVLQVVSPAVVDMGAFATLGVLATLTITTTPEPTTFLLLGSGLAALGAVARRRR